MTNSQIKGTGDSRYLKSISTFLTQYPTYADFAAALVAGTLPIDLNGINASGFDVIGTPLNKATLLSDTTAAALGLTGDPTPDDALLSRAVLTGTTDPTRETAGAIQQFYVNTATSVLFICVSFVGNVYTWLKLGTVIDGAISTTSENPLQNKVVTTQLMTKPTRTTGSGAPTGTANVGDFYNDTTNKYLYVYDGTDWRLVTTGVKYVRQHITNIITSSQTFTVPSNITGSITVACVGGGGGGGGGHTDYQQYYGEGGKSAARTISTVTLAGGNTIPIIIGAGGNGGEGGIDPNRGTDGANTSFGAYVTANGGNGGSPAYYYDFDDRGGFDYDEHFGGEGYTYNGVVYGSGGDGGSSGGNGANGRNGVVVLDYDVMVATPQ